VTADLVTVLKTILMTLRIVAWVLTSTKKSDPIRPWISIPAKANKFTQNVFDVKIDLDSILIHLLF